MFTLSIYKSICKKEKIAYHANINNIHIFIKNAVICKDVCILPYHRNRKYFVLNLKF